LGAAAESRRVSMQNQDIMERSNSSKVVIIGGGPAGLTAAYELSKKGVESVVFEKDQAVYCA